MKMKGLKSFLSRFLVCFKRRKVPSSPIRPEIEEEELTLELKGVLCEEDPAAGLNADEEIKAAGLNTGEEIKAAGLNTGEEIKVAGQREEPSAGIEVEEEPAAGNDAVEEPAAGNDAVEEPAAGFDAVEEPASGNDAVEEPAAGIEVELMMGIDAGEEPPMGIDAGEEPPVGIDAGDEDPAAGIDAGDEDPAAGINAGDEDSAAGIDAGDEDPAAGIDAGDEDPAVGIDAGDEDPAAGIDAGDEELEAGIEAGQEEPAVGIEAEEKTVTGIEAGDEESSAGIEEPVVGVAEDEPTMGIEAGEKEPAVGIEESVVVIEAEEEPTTGNKAGEEEPVMGIEKPTVEIDAEEEPPMGIKEPAAGLKADNEWKVDLVEAPAVEEWEKEPVAGLEYGEVVEDDLEEPILEGFVLEVQPTWAEEDPVAAQEASFSAVLEAFVSMNLKLHTLTAQLASLNTDLEALNTDLEAHGGVNNYLEEKFTWKLPRGLHDFVSPILEVPILEPAAALDAEEASPFANVENMEEVNLEEGTMKQAIILEVKEAYVSTDLEVHALTTQLTSPSAELEVFVGGEMLINSEEELTLKLATTFVVDEDFISPDVELLASDVSLPPVGFHIGVDVEEGQGDVRVVEDEDCVTMNSWTNDIKEGDVDSEDEEGRGSMNGGTYDIREGDVDSEDEEARCAINGGIGDVREGDVDSEDEEDRGMMNDEISDVKEGDVDSEDEDDRGVLNDWTSDVKEDDVDLEDEEDQGRMNEWIDDVKEGDVDLEDGDDQGTMNGWTCDVREGDVNLEDEEGRCAMKDWIGDVNAQDEEDRGIINGRTCDVKEGNAEDEEDRCTMNERTGDVKEGVVDSEDEEDRDTMIGGTFDVKKGDGDGGDVDDEGEEKWDEVVKEGVVDSEDEEDRGTLIGGTCDVNNGNVDGGDVDVDDEGEEKWDEVVRNGLARSDAGEDELTVDIEYEVGAEEEWGDGAQIGRAKSYDLEDGDVDVGGEGEDVYGEDNVDVKEGHHELAKEHLKHKVFEVFIGGLHKGATEDDLRNVFNQVGEITRVRLPMNPVTKKNRGFAFLRFATEEQAHRAILELKNPVINGRRCGVTPSWGRDAEREDEVMTQVTTIFIDGLPVSWDEDRIKHLVMRFGDIEKIELARDMPKARRSDFGFVTFITHEAAVTCAESINNAEFDKGDEQPNLRARLSRPFVKGRGKHAPVDFRSDKGALGDRLSWNLPPRLEFGGCDLGRGFRGRGAPIGGRSTGFAYRHSLMSGSDGARRLQYSNQVYNRRPQGYQSGGGWGDGRWSSSLHSGFLPYESDDVGCSSYSAHSGCYSSEERFFGGKTIYGSCY